MGALWLWFKASRYARWLAIAGAALMAFFVAQKRAEKRGADNVKAEINEDRIERMEAGNEAVETERAETSGADNRAVVDRLRRRDGDWGGV